MKIVQPYIWSCTGLGVSIDRHGKSKALVSDCADRISYRFISHVTSVSIAVLTKYVHRRYFTLDSGPSAGDNVFWENVTFSRLGMGIIIEG